MEGGNKTHFLRARFRAAAGAVVLFCKVSVCTPEKFVKVTDKMKKCFINSVDNPYKSR
jgi:hypothetical protein